MAIRDELTYATVGLIGAAVVIGFHMRSPLVPAEQDERAVTVISLPDRPVNVSVHAGSGMEPIVIEGEVRVEDVEWAGEVTVVVPKDAIRVEAPAPPVPVTVNVPEPLVVSHVVVREMHGDTAGRGRGTATHDVHFPPFRPFTDGLIGLKVPDDIGRELVDSLRALEGCGPVEIEVSGSASTT